MFLDVGMLVEAGSSIEDADGSMSFFDKWASWPRESGLHFLSFRSNQHFLPFSLLTTMLPPPPPSVSGSVARELHHSRRQWASLVLLIILSSAILGLSVFSSQSLEHICNVLLLPGLLPTLSLTFVAPLLTSYIIQSTKGSFLAKGFGGKDLLKGSKEQIPESLGLPVSLLYCMLMFCFIPFRYGGMSRDGETRSNSDGGWSGDMAGSQGFPHHEVSGRWYTRFSTELLINGNILSARNVPLFDAITHIVNHAWLSRWRLWHSVEA